MAEGLNPMKVKDLMSQPVISIEQHSSLADAARLMLDNGFGSLPVVDGDGLLVGLVTESSFSAKSKGIPFSTFRAPQVLGQWLSEKGVDEIFDASRQIPVNEIMVRSVVTIDEEADVSLAVKLMLEHDINRIPVVRDGVPVGIISRHDLLRMMIEKPNVFF